MSVIESMEAWDAFYQTLAGWTALEAPTGFEEPVLRRVHTELAECCERIEVDLRGNVYGWLPGADPEATRIMLTAHADEIGFLVTSILPDGYLRFDRLGHPTDLVLPGQRVRLRGRPDTVEGVIGVKPGHVLAGEEARRVPLLRDLYIDAGATSAAEVRSWGIDVGTPAVLVGELTRTRNPARCFGKSVDNRIGLVCVLEIVRRLSRSPIPATVCAVVTVEEEIGLRGAQVAAQRVQPDVVLAIDTVPSGGTPELRPDELPWHIGAGPLLKVRESKGLSTHPRLRELLLDVAQRRSLPVQVIVDTAGITDATSAQQARADLAAMVIGIARRYSHSSVELFDLRDPLSVIELLVAAIPQLSRREQLLRI